MDTRSRLGPKEKCRKISVVKLVPDRCHVYWKSYAYKNTVRTLFGEFPMY